MNSLLDFARNGNSTIRVCPRHAKVGWLGGLLISAGILWQPAAWAVETSPAEVAQTDAAAGLTPSAVERVQAAMAEAEELSAAALLPDPEVSKEVEERWGVQIIRVDATAGGFWLGFRFRVTDLEKALPLFDTAISPYLEAEKTGEKFGVAVSAKVGSLRTTNRVGNIHAGKIYNMVFGNLGAKVKPGDKVSVVAGDFKVEHLTVN